MGTSTAIFLIDATWIPVTGCLVSVIEMPSRVSIGVFRGLCRREDAQSIIAGRRSVVR